MLPQTVLPWSIGSFVPQIQHPQLKLTKDKIICNGATLDISKRVLGVRVIQAFLHDGLPIISKYQMLAIVFGEKAIHGRSERYIYSKLQNMNKMLSRLRQDFDKTFRDVTPPGMYWFYHCPNLDGWLLYKLPSSGSDGTFYN